MTLADLPLPPTDKPEAAAAYLRGIVALRGGSRLIGFKHLEAALKIDPLMAAAHLRLAVYISELATYSTSRVHYQQALARRETLTARDREIADTFEPFYRDPEYGRVDEYRAKFAAVAARHPNDAEITLLTVRLGSADAVDQLERAAELDPRFALPLLDRSYLELREGRKDEAFRTASRCIERSPDAIDCIFRRMDIHAERGNCAAMEADARTAQSRLDDSGYPYLQLGEALFAQGRSIESVREALAQAAALYSEKYRAAFEPQASASLAILVGDFRSADVLLADAEQKVGSLRSVFPFEPAGLVRVRLALEAGERDRAAMLADDLLKKRGVRNDEDDPRPLLYAVAVRGRRRTDSERREQLAAWIAAREADFTDAKHWRWQIWSEGFAQPAETRDEALAALGQRSAYPPFDGFNRLPQQVPEIHEGRLYALAAKPDEAIARLEPPATSCYALPAPFAYTQAWFWLGEARSAKGDTDGACRAYAVVLSRWGNAKPRSVTADAARARRASLRCADSR
jgi:serine/threonine-protein kinase